MATADSMKLLYRRLSQVGFKPKFVRERALPSWWDDEIASDDLGYTEALLIISNHLGLDYNSLKDPAAQLIFDSEPMRFYKRSSIPGEDMIAASIAERVARIALLGTPLVERYALPTAYTLRQTILQTTKVSVGFYDLLTYCWNTGIPVVHIKNFPSNIKKLDGVAIIIDERPAIVLCRKKTDPASHVFLLAHELGHLACHHLESEKLLIETTEDEYHFKSQTEKEADHFALNLIAGTDRLPEMLTPLSSPYEIAAAACEYGRSHQIDPGFLIRNHARRTGKWREAQSAITYHVEKQQNAIKWIDDEMRSRLKWDYIPKDSREFLLNITGGE